MSQKLTVNLTVSLCLVCNVVETSKVKLNKGPFVFVLPEAVKAIKQGGLRSCRLVVLEGREQASKHLVWHGAGFDSRAMTSSRAIVRKKIGCLCKRAIKVQRAEMRRVLGLSRAGVSQTFAQLLLKKWRRTFAKNWDSY